MLLELVEQTRRHGDGWVTWVSPTCVTLIVNDDNEDAVDAALDDLATWWNPVDWTLVASGWYEDGSSYYVYQWGEDHDLVTTSA